MARFSYYIDIEHKGLGKFRRISGSDHYVVEQKAREQQFLWAEQWSKKCAVETARQKRANLAFGRDAKKSEAAQRTLDAQRAISEMQSVISNTLSMEHATDWARYYDRRPFAESPPTRPAYPTLHQPLRSEAEFRPHKSLLYFVLRFVRRKRDADAESKFGQVRSKWLTETSAQKQGLAQYEASEPVPEICTGR